MAQQIITLTDTQRGSEAKILASYGFNLYSFRPKIQDEQVEVLWAAPDFEQGTARPSGSGVPLLFPFPGRIRGTTFTFEGQEYPLHPGDPLGNAIHGFVLDRPWRVSRQSEKEVTGDFQASIDDPSILKHWPADFLIRVRYLLAGNRIVSDIHIENPSDRPLPFGFGTHPYFRVPLGNGNAARCVVSVPTKSYWELKEMLPTGRKLPADQKGTLAAGMEFEKTQFDDVFTDLEFEDETCTARVVDPGSALTLVLSFGREFRECVVYNPPHREAICLEPYTCVPDPFTLAEQGIDSGLRVLAPGESFDTTIEMRIDERIGE